MFGWTNKYKTRNEKKKKIQVQNRRLCLVCAVLFFLLDLVNRTTVLCCTMCIILMNCTTLNPRYALPHCRSERCQFALVLYQWQCVQCGRDLVGYNALSKLTSIYLSVCRSVCLTCARSANYWETKIKQNKRTTHSWTLLQLVKEN